MWIITQILLIIVLIMAIISLAPRVYAQLGRLKIGNRSEARTTRGRRKVDYILYSIIAVCLVVVILLIVIGYTQ